MVLKDKKILLSLLNTTSQILETTIQSKDKKDVILDSLEAINLIKNELKNQHNIPETILEKIDLVEKLTYELFNDIRIIDRNSIQKIKKEIRLISSMLEHEVKAKLKVVFFPYKLSMWDSLETIYNEAIKDENCEVKVIPIPYYELFQDNKVEKYEGDRFSKHIPVTHFREYDLEEEKPDIIYVHNIYDQFNTITRVYDEYFTSNLKKHTDMLVFVPYHISSLEYTGKERFLAYNVPTIMNVDKVILAGEYVKEAAIRDGVPEEKLLVLGSPKFDKIIESMQKKTHIPKEWKEKIKNKKVFVLNTGCLFFSNDFPFKIGLLADFLNIPNIVEDSVLIWRPHPLTRVSIKQYTPYLLDYYDTLIEEYIGKNLRYKDIILDQTDNYMSALMVADILISKDGSLLSSYLVTGKKIIYLDKNIPKSKSALNRDKIFSDGFHYFYSENELWSDVVKKVFKGEGNIKNNRDGILKSRYVNTDGTCGKKVYNAIKEYIIS